MTQGTVFWLTGLSGAGKTTIGCELFHQLRREKDNVLFLDGDALREVFGDGAGHTLDERRQLAFTYARLCRMLARQGQDVVCATISMFQEVRRWNRENIPMYREVYVRVPMAVLYERDQKQLYSRAQRGEVSQVMGVDLPIEEPESPDLVLDNDGSIAPERQAEAILTHLTTRGNTRS